MWRSEERRVGIEDPDLRTWHTSATARFRVRLVLAVASAAAVSTTRTAPDGSPDIAPVGTPDKIAVPWLARRYCAERRNDHGITVGGMHSHTDVEIGRASCRDRRS